MNAKTEDDGRIGVLFVCMGNICRSPTAEGVFRDAVARAGLDSRFRIDSAGTHRYHTGKPSDARAVATAHRHGVDLSALRARPVDDGDFYLYNYILAADDYNLSILRNMSPDGAHARLDLLMAFAPPGYPREVPDPYYGAGDGFERVYEMVAAACQGFLEEVE